MDYLVMGDYLFRKEDQPRWEEGQRWKDEFHLD
jgi:carbamoyltransferase